MLLVAATDVLSAIIAVFPRARTVFGF
jgi:hypothetical protein